MSSVDPAAAPELLPGRSAIATVSLPAFGGTSSRRSPDFGADVDAVPPVDFGAGAFGAGAFGSVFGAPVSATSVGFAGALPCQFSICERTCAAASLTEPTDLI